MKKLKTYENFSEEYRLNENLLSMTLNKIVDFFKKKFLKHAWLYYNLFLKKIGKLPKWFDIYDPSHEDGAGVPSKKEVKMAISESYTIKGFTIENINEDAVNLKSDTEENIDAATLKQTIIDIYEKNKRRVEKGKERKMNDALFIWGAPGIGKTSIIKQVVKELDIKLATWHLASTDPTDVRGIPTIENMTPGSVDLKDQRTVTKLPAAFPTSNCENGKGGILFFDELNQAKQMILSAALPIILEGEIGEYVLPSMWIVIAAGNREEDLAGGGTRFEAPLSNRFKHLNYAPELLTDFIPYAINNEEMNPDLISFLTFKQEYFHKLNTDSEKVTKAWPSPRSWELASSDEYFKRGDNWDSRPLSRTQLEQIYAPRVGREAATAFLAYLDLKEYFNENDVKDVFNKGGKARPLPNDLAQCFAASGSIAGYKKGEKFTENEIKNFLDYTEVQMNSGKKGLETATPLLAWMKTMHPDIKEDPKLLELYMEFVKKWHIKMEDIEDANPLNKIK